MSASWSRTSAVDVRDAEAVAAAVAAARPEVVFHLAARAIVRAALEDPAGTYAVNVLGTAHVLDAARDAAVVCVTSDKCYAPGPGPHREGDPLGGRDPYSSSKAAQELVAAAYRDSLGARVATARAGNVIGGGDWGRDRLLPDLARARETGEPVVLRHPDAVRPWQHVLDPLAGYLALAERLHGSAEWAAPWNFGPEDSRPVGWVVERVREHWRLDVRVDDPGDGVEAAGAAARRLRGARAAAMAPPDGRRGRARRYRLLVRPGPLGSRPAGRDLRADRGTDLSIGIVGLGYVGLPLAVSFAEAGEQVIGVDVDRERVTALSGGRSPIEDVSDETPSARARLVPLHHARRRAARGRGDPRLRPDAAHPQPRARPRPAAGRHPRVGGRGAARPGDRPRVDHLPGHHTRAPGAAARGVGAAGGRGLRARLLARARRPGPHRLHDPHHAEGRGRPDAALHRARRRGLRARLRPPRAGHHARGGRALEAAGEHLPLGQHRARQRDGPAGGPHGDRHLGGHRRGGHQAVRLHALRPRARHGRPLPARRPVLPRVEGARVRPLGRVHRAGRQDQPVAAVLLRGEGRAHAQRRRQAGPRVEDPDPGRVLQGRRRRHTRVARAEDHRAAAGARRRGRLPRPARAGAAPSWGCAASGSTRGWTAPTWP